MTYQEVLENARAVLSKNCKACPVCNGKACGNHIPGPGAKGVGDTAIRNYEKWQAVRVNMDTIHPYVTPDTSLNLFGKTFLYPFFAGPVGAVTVHYSDKYDDMAYNNILVKACADNGIAAFTGDGLNGEVMKVACKAIAASGGTAIRFFHSTQFNYGIFVALFCVAAITWMLYKTPFGFSLRAMGQNPRAMQQAGLPIYRRTLAAMCISGGLFALGGAIQCLAVYKRFVMGFSPGYGWDGITVATLAMNSPVGVLLSAFLFGMLRSASISMSLTSQVTTEMISVLQGFIVMLVASPDVWNVLGRLCQRIGIRRKQEGAAE